MPTFTPRRSLHPTDSAHHFVSPGFTFDTLPSSSQVQQPLAAYQRRPWRRRNSAAKSAEQGVAVLALGFGGLDDDNGLRARLLAGGAEEGLGDAEPACGSQRPGEAGLEDCYRRDVELADPQEFTVD